VKFIVAKIGKWLLFPQNIIWTLATLIMFPALVIFAKKQDKPHE